MAVVISTAARPSRPPRTVFSQIADGEEDEGEEGRVAERPDEVREDQVELVEQEAEREEEEGGKELLSAHRCAA